MEDLLFNPDAAEIQKVKIRPQAPDGRSEMAFIERLSIAVVILVIILLFRQ